MNRKKVINYYAEGVKDGYFRIAGSDQYLSGPFANEQVAMFIGSIAGEGYVKKKTPKANLNMVSLPAQKKSIYNKEQTYICSQVHLQRNVPLLLNT